VDIQEAIDKQAILDIQTYYSRSIDAGEYGNLDGVFSANVVAEYGRAGQHHGVETIKAACQAALDPLTSVQHLNGNHWAEIHGDSAQAGCYFVGHAYRHDTPGGDHYVTGGRYDDELERTGQGWRITKRTLTVLWTDGNPAVRFG
jgi:hypothetical protein